MERGEQINACSHPLIITFDLNQTSTQFNQKLTKEQETEIRRERIRRIRQLRKKESNQ